jgi:hypothetical protein
MGVENCLPTSLRNADDIFPTKDRGNNVALDRSGVPIKAELQILNQDRVNLRSLPLDIHGQ